MSALSTFTPTHGAEAHGTRNGPTKAGSGAFPMTHWTRIRQCAAGDDSEAARHALDSLCRDYWFPLYAFARRCGNGREDSQDLVQGFFAKAIADKLFGKADPLAGRLRAFLLTSFKNYQSSVNKKVRATKRGGNGWNRVDWDEAEQLLKARSGTGGTPEEEFDRHWALRMLNRAVQILEKQYAITDRSILFKELRAFLKPDDPGDTEIARIAQTLSMNIEAVRQAVCRVRERFRATLRQLIADTLESPEEADVDFEMETLRRALLPA